MKSYIGTKIILAEPMDAHIFTLHIRAIPGVTPEIQPNGRSQPGYKVVYPDGYISWSPEVIFNAAYREITEWEARIIQDSLNDLFEKRG